MKQAQHRINAPLVTPSLITPARDDHFLEYHFINRPVAKIPRYVGVGVDDVLAFYDLAVDSVFTVVPCPQIAELQRRPYWFSMSRKPVLFCLEPRRRT